MARNTKDTESGVTPVDETTAVPDSNTAIDTTGTSPVDESPDLDTVDQAPEQESTPDVESASVDTSTPPDMLQVESQPADGATSTPATEEPNTDIPPVDQTLTPADVEKEPEVVQQDPATNQALPEAPLDDASADSIETATPEVETIPTPVSPSVVSVKAIIASDDKTIIEKLEAIMACGIPVYQLLAGNLHNYIKRMDGTEVVSNTEGAALNHSLYTTIVNAADTEDKSTFKTLFDIINLTFAHHKEGVFSLESLMRFDQDWKYGAEKLLGFRYIATLIHHLSDITTRKDNLNSISIDAAVKPERTGFGKTLIDNIKHYYMS